MRNGAIWVENVMHLQLQLNGEGNGPIKNLEEQVKIASELKETFPSTDRPDRARKGRGALCSGGRHRK